MTKAQVATRRQPNAIVRWARETIVELRKVNWPTRREASRLTVIVLVTLFTLGTVLGLLDYLFSQFFGLIISLF